jgi:deoxyribonuclease-4
MRIGAHESIAGGLWKAFGRAEADGAESLQIFTKSGRQWAAKPLADEDVRAFRQEADRTGLPVIAHASYLLNLGAAEGEIRRKSLAALREEVERCAVLGIPWLVLHPGANEDVDAGVALVIDGIRQVLTETRGLTAGICLEVTAGQGSSLGHRFEELGRMLDGIDEEDRTGACLDSCHLFAAGYDLSTDAGYAGTMTLFERTVGFGRLRALHLNDAKKGLGCRVDRHDHIGEGTLGLATFMRLVTDARFSGLPAVLETPEGKWPEEIALLKRLREDGATQASGRRPQAEG